MAETVLQRAQKADQLIEKMTPPAKLQNMLPKMFKMVPMFMILGLILVLVAFGMGISAADSMGDAVGLMDPDSPDAAAANEAQEDAARLTPLLAPTAFVGMALILFGISVTLLAIAGALRTMGTNVVGLILEHEGGA